LEVVVLGSATMPVINCLSIDVEGFYEARLEALNIDPAAVDRPTEIREIETNMHYILQLLQDCQVQATFFFTGSSVEALPHLVSQVKALGHEVGSHNYFHWRVDGLDPETFRRGMERAVGELQDVLGSALYGFRAPQFSVSKATLWATDILAELGFHYDSSMYPVALRRPVSPDDACPHIHRLPNGLIEFPATTVAAFNRRLPAAGGGYYRLYPLWFSRYLVSHVNHSGHPSMFFIHPYEVGPMRPRMPNLSPFWRWRLYHNAGSGDRLRHLLDHFQWEPAITILERRGLVESNHGN